MEFLNASLMAIAMGTAAGMRPYFTVLIAGLAVWLVPENSPSWLEDTVGIIPEVFANPWVLAICAILAITEAGIDKIPVVDISMESVSSWLRPILASLVGLGLGAGVSPEAAILTTILGGASAIPVSLGKTSTTAASQAVPGSGILRSLAEDLSAFLLTLGAILLPVLAAALGVVAIATGIGMFFVFRRAFRTVRTKFSEVREVRQARQEILDSREYVPFDPNPATREQLRRVAEGNF